jgi:mannose-6-phosphate isomerase-like protein (cupin superfamily)
MSAVVGQHFPHGAGEAWWFLDTRMTIKADARQTGGAHTLLEFSAPHGFGPPLHQHNEDDEGFFVLEGEMHVQCGDDSWEMGPGGFAFLPRGIPHTFIVTSMRPVRGLQLTSPSGFEKFVADIGVPAEGPGLPVPSPPDVPRLASAAARYGHEILGPPLSLRDERFHGDN